MYIKNEKTKGIAYSVAAFLFWGILPVYWKYLDQVPSLEVMAHRLIWTFVFMVCLSIWQRKWKTITGILKSRKIVLTLLLTSILISINWFVYILAVNNDQVLEVSMGYFINPLLSVLLGMVFLKERLRFRQAIAVALVFAGVMNMAVQYGKVPWVSLTLAFSFGFYGLLRKTVQADSHTGLFVESSILSSLAFIYLIVKGMRGQSAFGTADLQTHLLLIGAGPITALPILWFAHGVRRIPLSMVGFIQYLAPSCFFLLGVFLFKEPFTQVHLITFVLIWLGILTYSMSNRIDSVKVKKG